MSEASDEEAGFASIVFRAGKLVKRLGELASAQGEAGAWFAMWNGVVAALIGLAKTLFALAMRLKDVALSPEPVAAMGDDLRDEIGEDLRDIADEFPDVADIMFGLSHLDELWAAIAEDDEARATATSLLNALGAMLDRFIDAAFDVVLGEREPPVSPDDVVAFIQRYESVAQNLIDRWLQPALERR